MYKKQLSDDAIMQVKIDGELKIAYDPFPVSQSGQRLDLTQNKIVLLPERETISFDSILYQLREHARAWFSYACHKYSNYSLRTYSAIWNLLKIEGVTEDDISERLEECFRSLMTSDRSSSTKTALRNIYGWCVEEGLPYFDEDFYDYYLARLKFGTDEGKGLDVIIEMPNRGPLTIKEERLFIEALNRVSPDSLSLLELQGLVSLKCAQILGARNIQVVKLTFSDLKCSENGVYSLNVMRAKQEGYSNNLVFKVRPVTKTLARLIALLKSRYEEMLQAVITDDWPIIADYDAKTNSLLKQRVRLGRISYLTNLFRIAAGLDFKVTNRRLRKTFCSRLIAKGTPMRVVAELMDHSDLQQLEVYYRQSHTIAQKLDQVLRKEAIDIIDAFAGKVIKPEEVTQTGQGIFAPSKQQNLVQIGSCGSGKPCSLQPPLSCYNCSSLEAFEDVDHRAVVDAMVDEVKTTFGEKHAINILQHKNFLAARKFADMFEQGAV